MGVLVVSFMVFKVSLTHQRQDETVPISVMEHRHADYPRLNLKHCSEKTRHNCMSLPEFWKNTSVVVKGRGDGTRAFDAEADQQL